MLRHTFGHHHVGQRFDHLGRAPSTLRSDHQALPAVLIDKIQHPHRPSVVGLGAYEVVAPYMVGMLGTQPHAGPVVEPQPPSRLLFLWNLQPFATPDPLYPIFANLPSIALQQRRNPTVAVAPILAGQLHDGPGESIFVFALCQLIALRAAWLLHQPARSALTQALFLSMIHRTTPSFTA